MKRYLKLFPLIVICASILLGINNGLRTTVSENSHNSLGNVVNYLFMISNLTESRGTWLVIMSHNILWSFLCGILGLLSGGIFASKYLFEWWSLWVLTLKTHSDVTTWLFVLLESFSMTSIVITVMYMGFGFFIEKKVLLSQKIILILSVTLLLVGAAVESYDISKPVI